MIERYLNDDVCERFQQIRLELGGSDWEHDDVFVSHLLDFYEDFKFLESNYKKLKFKYRLLKSKFKVFYYFHKLLFEK